MEAIVIISCLVLTYVLGYVTGYQFGKARGLEEAQRRLADVREVGQWPKM